MRPNICVPHSSRQNSALHQTGTEPVRCRIKSMICQIYPSWQGRLRQVKRIYVFVDKKTGQHYVGSAKGEDSLRSADSPATPVQAMEVRRAQARSRRQHQIVLGEGAHDHHL
jgi:hypothetical protein